MMPEVIINNQESKSLNLSNFVSINGISFFTYNPVNFKASRIYRSTFSRPQKVENLHSLIYDEFKIHNIFNMRINKVVCCYENNLASFVPKSLFEEESLSEYLNKNIDLKENDLSYYVLMIASEFKIDSNTIPLYIIGEIVYQDNYYNELYKFVRSINFLRPLTRLNFESKPMNIHKDFCLINAIECV